MSFVLLYADQLSTVLADNPLVPGADVTRIEDATALLQAARTLRDEAATEAQSARTKAEEAGYAAGLAKGRTAGEEEMRDELLRLFERERESQAKRREEIARLGLEVVRRIAGDVGEGVMVAGLAERAAAAVSPEEPVTVRVPPDAFPQTSARLGDRPGLVVEADPSLDAGDCVIETALGSAHAGLDTQIASLERTWGMS